MAKKKVVLLYSGGLDTSVMLKWLQDELNYDVICYCSDLGQAEELDGLPEKAKKTGAKKIYIDDLREEFVRDYVFRPSGPMWPMRVSTSWAPLWPGR